MCDMFIIEFDEAIMSQIKQYPPLSVIARNRVMYIIVAHELQGKCTAHIQLFVTQHGNACQPSY